MDFKEDFPIFKNRDIAYLDSGATAQKPQIVIDAINNFYDKFNANPHRGAYTLSVEATAVYEDTRAKIAKFINAKHPEEIIFSLINIPLLNTEITVFSFPILTREITSLSNSLSLIA